jgi:hypothetical protein
MHISKQQQAASSESKQLPSSRHAAAVAAGMHAAQTCCTAGIYMRHVMHGEQASSHSEQEALLAWQHCLLAA